MSGIKKYSAVLLGLGITLLFLVLWFVDLSFLSSLEFKLYDARMGLRSDTEKPSDIVLVNVDDDSIEKIGRWPWSRSVIAGGIRKISEGGPKVIGLSIIFSEPEENAALKELKGLQELFQGTGLDRENGKDAVFGKAMSDAILRLDNDKTLEDALRDSGAVVLPIVFKGIGAADGGGQEDASELAAQAFPNVKVRSGQDYCPLGSDPLLPLKRFLMLSRGVGHINVPFDIDGKVRREQLLYKYNGMYIPSYTLKLAMQFLDVPGDKLRADMGSAIYLNSLVIPTDLQSGLLINFKGPHGAFKSYPFYDVVNDKIPLSIFKNKLVLVSTTASGLSNPLSTPVNPGMFQGEFSAHTIWAILNKRFIQQPYWASMAELSTMLVLGLVIAFVLPRLRAMVTAVTFVVLLVLLVGGNTYLFVSKGLWAPLVYPVLQLLFGYLGVVSLQYFTTEATKEKVEGESAETNRMLGLSFQSQGMLDMAFDKFRRVPVDDGMKDILYNLALDYERKRQFNKAVAVFEYIERYDAKFKDIEERKKKLIQVGETVVLGAGMGPDGLIATGTDTRPTLGRYEVVKQLGKGAMGVVYMGLDPRINRTTAIKTFRFSADYEPEEAEKMKQKFFVEAESAGTLSHPHIVTIYDAGEEQELAYIAMEYLEGRDLQNFTKEDKLLPLRKVMDYTADIADALDYAHEKGIVHRDIKPANIMLLNTGAVKITDFGIARITATSQTQTGVLKGTPYYMSPEQISGQKVDGRSDIFSLGVMLFQLLTGHLPFQGDNLAALMHQIMNVPHPDPRQHNPRIFKPLVDIINRALEKDRDRRYQRAGEMATHLRKLGKKLDEMIAEKRGKQNAA